jgi:mRNA interferase HigB
MVKVSGCVKVIGINRLEQFGRKHSRAKSALRAWLLVARQSKWKNLMEVRRTINTVSGGVNRSFTIFNIGGNNFRLITVINYETETILIADFLTHAEYDKWSQK